MPPAGFLSTLVTRREAKRGMMTHHIGHVYLPFCCIEALVTPFILPRTPYWILVLDDEESSKTDFSTGMHLANKFQVYVIRLPIALCILTVHVNT
jgi:hypothetical protein